MAPDPMALAATAMHAGVQSLLVTLGKRGVVYVLAPGFDRLDDLRRARATSAWDRCVQRWCPRSKSDTPGDPTGCGDVFGATYFSRLLPVIRLARRCERRFAQHHATLCFRGAGGLANFLRGELLQT